MGIEAGRGYRTEVGTALAAAMSVTGISKASAAVVSGSGFSVVAGDYVYMGQVDGMVELSYVVARVAASPTPTASAFTLEGIDSTNFGTWSASAGVQKINTWSTLAQATSVDFGAGQVESLDATTLLDVARQLVGQFGRARQHRQHDGHADDVEHGDRDEHRPGAALEMSMGRAPLPLVSWLVRVLKGAHRQRIQSPP